MFGFKKTLDKLSEIEKRLHVSETALPAFKPLREEVVSLRKEITDLRKKYDHLLLYIRDSDGTDLTNLAYYNGTVQGKSDSE